MKENEKTKAISFRVSISRFLKMKEVAERMGMVPGVLARYAVFELLEKQKAKDNNLVLGEGVDADK